MGTIQEGRVCELLGLLRDIQDKTDQESLARGLKKVFKNAETDGFDFGKRNPTGYVYSVAKTYKAEKDRRSLTSATEEEREDLRKMQEGAVSQNLKGLINIQEGSS